MKIEKSLVFNCCFNRSGITYVLQLNPTGNSGLAVKGFRSCKEVKTIAIQFITQGYMMRSSNQACEGRH